MQFSHGRSPVTVQGQPDGRAVRAAPVWRSPAEIVPCPPVFLHRLALTIPGEVSRDGGGLQRPLSIASSRAFRAHACASARVAKVFSMMMPPGSVTVMVSMGHPRLSDRLVDDRS